ncbi:helix-turn-helix domain-containing protein [Actinospica sp. MGRD01-02]|uniref:Helix-turn-helix domain-containing protein n=1 Tax=Actinospica acidithermotolerans TaxID=2828514 RepID=A0A941IIB3_9ACTN|nr:helix-turn-helix domain-containing protein [Actinospica acidithermotolerans]MBR7825973.1 helix-turn-helix domain-containing protein [Actinospica acidithermotolerans]
MILEPHADRYEATGTSAETADFSEDAGLPASVLAARCDVLAEAITDQIMKEVAAHDKYPAREVLVRTCRAHLDALLRVPVLSADKRAGEKAAAQERERSALVGAILDGHVERAQTLWDTVEALRLPHDGPYVVVAAETLEIGEQEGIRVVERGLSVAGLRSAWWVRAAGHAAVAGVVAVRGTAWLEALTDVLSTAWPHRSGISPRFQELSGARRAHRFATLAMVSAPRGSAVVTAFEKAPLAVLAASAPDVMAELADAVLGSINQLPEEDRAVLLGTLRTWLACGGSVDTAAQMLFCHPNTVRYRLNRVTERTGRTLADPQAVSELALALQADNLA